jgi:3-dehydroquinate synthase
MMCAARLSHRLGRVDVDFISRQRNLLQAMGLPIDLPSADDEQLLAAMFHDKKTEHGQLRFVLPNRLGNVELVVGVDSMDVRTSLRN